MLNRKTYDSDNKWFKISRPLVLSGNNRLFDTVITCGVNGEGTMFEGPISYKFPSSTVAVTERDKYWVLWAYKSTDGTMIDDTTANSYGGINLFLFSIGW